MNFKKIFCRKLAIQRLKDEEIEQHAITKNAQNSARKFKNEQEMVMQNLHAKIALQEILRKKGEIMAETKQSIIENNRLMEEIANMSKNDSEQKKIVAVKNDPELKEVLENGLQLENAVQLRLKEMSNNVNHGVLGGLIKSDFKRD